MNQPDADKTHFKCAQNAGNCFPSCTCFQLIFSIKIKHPDADKLHFECAKSPRRMQECILNGFADTKNFHNGKGVTASRSVSVSNKLKVQLSSKYSKPS